jgi:hypothetical protein
MATTAPPMEVQFWSIDRLVFYARNSRQYGAGVDRACGRIREFGFKLGTSSKASDQPGAEPDLSRKSSIE